MRYLRARGFRGLFTIFSNGVKAERLLEILDSDARSEAVLNYSIYHGRDAEPLPPHAQAAARDVGARASQPPVSGLQGPLPRRRGRRRRRSTATARPTSTASARLRALLPGADQQGRFHACPFAAEIDSPHYDLGSVGTDPPAVFGNYRTFRRWIDDVLDPAARARGVT